MSWHPTLGSIERATDLPQDRQRPITDTQRRESRLPVIYGDGCWCLEPFGHDWPGKDSGAPHPKE